MKKLKGLTLIELLGVMAVVVIISSIAVGGVVGAQNKAKRTAALTAIDNYTSAFEIACIEHPGLIKDRRAAWPAVGSYSSEFGLKRLAAYMNMQLDDSLDFTWDDDLGYYVSYGTDPWGGKYILTEYPQKSGVESYYDASVAPNDEIMCASVWVTGNNDSILESNIISKDCYGVGLFFKDGVFKKTIQRFYDEYYFDTYTLTFN